MQKLRNPLCNRAHRFFWELSNYFVSPAHSLVDIVYEWLDGITYSMFFCPLITCLSSIYADLCASVPPSLWCSNNELSHRCGFKNLCGRYQAATYNQRVNITILMEALCPDSQQFIIENVYPNIYQNFADFVNIEFIPYGNAKVVNGTLECQFGPEECSANRFESCLIDTVETQDLYVPLIYCIENHLTLEFSFDNATAECFRSLSVADDTQKMIRGCYDSRLGEQLQQKAAEQTAKVWPDKHRTVPWIVVNGISLESVQRMRDQLPLLICEWYTGDEKIPYCQSEQTKK